MVAEILAVIAKVCKQIWNLRHWLDLLLKHFCIICQINALTHKPLVHIFALFTFWSLVI